MNVVEICLFCNLTKIFKKYEGASLESLERGIEVIQPGEVRRSLEQIYTGTLAGAAFSQGQMGCAQETLESILDYLHREYVNPNFLENYLNAKSDSQKFKIQKSLDDAGCTPKCASHTSFGFQTMELTACA